MMAGSLIGNTTWNHYVTCAPDESIDLRQFDVQYALNKGGWDAAFEFMRQTNFTDIAPGRYPLTEDGRVYASVSEYETKSRGDLRFEAHRRYIDLQYVISGMEYINLRSLGRMGEPFEYDEEKDVAFFDGKHEGRMLCAHNEVYFLFFPGDVHKPGIRMGLVAAKVKKLVVKIPYIQP
jgi:YhcH/YjgK/YiaL family protein